ncbi:MAG: OmpA family protein, partial [Bacteroidales bacterium]
VCNLRSFEETLLAVARSDTAQQSAAAEWQPRFNIGTPINTAGNEGAQTITADGRHLFFTACNRPDGKGQCDIYYSYKKGDTWTLPKNLGNPVNTQYWESQPSVSADGRSLFFVSNRPGNLGNTDIYVTHLSDDGKWSPPKNLGKVINTEGSENSPFIHNDGTTLYFASNGHVGMGGMDLFRSTWQNNEWTTPQNLGYPINTWKDETGLIINAKGDVAIFASEREDTFGGIDLYQFELPQSIRPLQVLYLKGIITDSITKQPLAAQIELFDVETSNLIIRSFSDPVTGNFLFTLTVGKEYALNVAKQGYLFYSENFKIKKNDTTLDTYKTITLQPIQVGKSVILKNIFFDTDSFNLKPASKVELDKLTDFLIKNPTIKIEIGGHTDNTGNKQKNIELSQLRAKSVYNYLVENKITANRLFFKGYGDSKPVVPNTSETNKAKNRRTEFMIIE